MTGYAVVATAALVLAFNLFQQRTRERDRWRNAYLKASATPTARPDWRGYP
ncbi:MAG: hypothetical protein ACRDTI_20635 [Mycobacterium sp.]